MRVERILAQIILVLIALPVIGSAMQPNVSGNIDVVINGYDDGVIVDLYANLTSTINKTVESEGQLKLIVDAKTDMPSEDKLVTNGTIDVIAIADALKENKVNANIWLTYKSVKGYGELKLEVYGNYTNVNGTLDFNVKLNSSGDVNNTTVSLLANIVVPIDMIGEDAAKQLVMMTAFLTARTANLYLEQLNMTFIKFKKLDVTANIDKQNNVVNINADVLFYINSTEALIYQEEHGASSPIVGANITTSPPVIPSIQTPFNPSKETNISAELKGFIKTIDNQLKINILFYSETTGDLEKASEESHRELVKTIKEANGTLPPGLDEIYLAPNPGKFKLVLDATKPGQVDINVVAEGLRFKHVNLTGDEAQRRTAAIILGYLAAIQSYLPSTVNVNVKINNIAKTEPDEKIKNEVSNYLGTFTQGLPLPLPIQHTSTATITTSYITSTIQTTTPTNTTTTTTQATTQSTTQTTTTPQTTTQPSTSQTTSTQQTTTQTTSPSTSSPKTTTTTGTGGGGELWTWIAVATIIVVVVVVGLLYIVLKKR